MQQDIHPTAIIEDGATLGRNIKIGAYSIIESKVKIGDNCIVAPHVMIQGNTEIGENNHFFQFSSIGAIPQDKKYKKGDDTKTIIGSNNTFREYVTVNSGTVQDLDYTKIGNDNWIMASVHIAHDCVLGDNNIIANATALAGHVVIGDNTVIGGYSLVHQFCNIGDYAMTAMGSVVNQEIPPYVLVSGHFARVHGINSIGLARNNFSVEDIKQIKTAYKIIYKEDLTLQLAIEKLAEIKHPNITKITTFLKNVKRGISR